MEENTIREIPDLLKINLKLNSETQIIERDNEYLIYFYNNKKYFRLSHSAIKLLNILGDKVCTGEDLIDYFCNQEGLNKDQVKDQLNHFMFQMIQRGIILYVNSNFIKNMDNSLLDRGEQQEEKTGLQRPILKIGTSYINKLFSFVKPRYSDVSLPTMIGLCLVFVGLLSFYFYIVNKNQILYIEKVHLNLPIFLYVTPWLILHLVCHEFSHAIVTRLHGGKVREVGVGLLYYVIPVAFVDLTDIYRLPKRSRAIISLAGPLFDITAATITAIIFFTQQGDVKFIAYYILSSQLFIIIFNCNLLFPSDIYRAIESMSGEMNLRKHSFEYLRSILFNKEKASYLKNISSTKEIFYVSYAMIATLYIIAFLLVIIVFYIKQITVWL